MPSRLQRQFHVTGTQYISTDKVQSQTLNTGGTAETFSPWANKPRAFFTIFRYQGQKVVRACTIRLLNLGSAKHEKGTKYLLPLTSFNLSHQTRHPTLGRISAAPFCPCISQYTAQKFICLVCICRSRVDLSAWKSALFRKISLSERSEFEIFLNAFSRFSDT